MGGVIYLIEGGERLVRLDARPYDSEDDFQSLLQKFPALLAGEQIDRSAPRRWLLVSREIGVPGEKDGPDRWSLDHLFLDQDGIPTLVEVKRQQDSRIRREVVGQMLDYAANAVAYWPAELIRDRFIATHEGGGVEPDSVLKAFLGDEAEPDDFWAKVAANLSEGRLRLVFLADRVPAELQRIVEFLNQQMNPAEVLAIEVTRYVGENFETHVPRVIGMTGQAQITKTSIRGVWDEARFFERAAEQLDEGKLTALRQLYDFFSSRASSITWGTGAVYGSFNPKFPELGRNAPVTVSTNGDVQFKLTAYERPRPRRFAALLSAALEGAAFPVAVNEPYPIVKIDRWAPQLATFAKAFSEALDQFRAEQAQSDNGDQ